MSYMCIVATIWDIIDVEHLCLNKKCCQTTLLWMTKVALNVARE